MLGTLSYYNQLHIVAYCKPINVGIEKYKIIEFIHEHHQK